MARKSAQNRPLQSQIKKSRKRINARQLKTGETFKQLAKVFGTTEASLKKFMFTEPQVLRANWNRGSKSAEKIYRQTGTTISVPKVGRYGEYIRDRMGRIQFEDKFSLTGPLKDVTLPRIQTLVEVKNPKKNKQYIVREVKKGPYKGKHYYRQTFLVSPRRNEQGELVSSPRISNVARRRAKAIYISSEAGEIDDTTRMKLDWQDYCDKHDIPSSLNALQLMYMEHQISRRQTLTILSAWKKIYNVSEPYYQATLVRFGLKGGSDLEAEGFDDE